MSKTCKINDAKTMKRCIGWSNQFKVFLIQGPKRFPILTSTPHYYPDQVCNWKDAANANHVRYLHCMTIFVAWMNTRPQGQPIWMVSLADLQSMVRNRRQKWPILPLVPQSTLETHLHHRFQRDKKLPVPSLYVLWDVGSHRTLAIQSSFPLLVVA